MDIYSLFFLFEMSYKCQYCKKDGTLRCSKCKRVFYCSKECQLRDWPIHKSVCGKFLKDYTDSIAVGVCRYTDFLEIERISSSVDIL